MKMIEYSEYRLGSLCTRFSSGKGISADLINETGRYPVIGGNGLRGYTDTYNFDGECAVIGRQGAYCGNVQFFSGKGYMTEHAVVTQPNSANNAKYLTYKLSGLSLGRFSGQAAQPGLSVTKLARLRIEMPPKWYQDKVADILSSYDDMIEVNSKRIKTLEQMAENLYKEWFIRFRFPGHETAEFENGIPKGWQISRIEDFCYVTDGTHDTPKPTENGVPLVTGKFIEDGDINFDEAYLISEADHDAIKKRSGLSTGDILFSNIGTVGKSCIVDYQREFSVKNVIIFKPDGFDKALFLYYWLTSTTMQEVFSTQTNGASQQFVGLSFMRRYKIMVPPQTIISQFEDQIYPIYQLQVLLRNNRKKLTKQRDLLLPRLMSGKLEV